MQRMESQGLTISLWDDYSVPMAKAVAAIGRINRFQGRLRVPSWTVLHHSILGFELMQMDFRERSQSAFVRDCYLHFLLHDIPEAHFGDVNGSTKGGEQKIQERRSLQIMCCSLGIDEPAGKVAKAVKEIDNRCRSVEAKCFGDLEDAMVAKCAENCLESDIQHALAVREMYWRQEHTMTPEGQAIKDYMDLIEWLLPSARARVAEVAAA
jgi:5'-deoxynucleotidase YfbR-like HD superfamily hydrolase